MQLKKETQGSNPLVKYYKPQKEEFGEPRAQSSAGKWLLSAVRPILRHEWKTAVSKAGSYHLCCKKAYPWATEDSVPTASAEQRTLMYGVLASALLWSQS